MHGLTTKRTVAIATGFIAVLACTSVAFAFWTSGGAGDGTATTALPTSAITVHQTSELTGMFPGDTPQDLAGDFTNSGEGPIHVSNVTVSIDSVTAANGDALTGCSGADYTLAGASMDIDQNIAVGDPNGSWDGATIQFNDTDANQDACEGATVNLSYVAT